MVAQASLRAIARSRFRPQRVVKRKTRTKLQARKSKDGRTVRRSTAPRQGRRAAAQRTAREDDEDDDEDENTDDEDSDDEQRDILEERLRQEELLESLPRNLDAKAKNAPHLATTAKKVPYQIAIPTYGRWLAVKDMCTKRRFLKCKTPFILVHTLAFLSRQRIPKANVTLFVASQQELKNYRSALKGSEWENVKIVISVLGNKNSRNFIYTYFPDGTYVVSIDDDVERISWKFREGITHHSLGALPPGSLEKIIFDAYKRMNEKNAFLWGVNTSQNPRHMKHYNVSIKNGLVNGYLNGFIVRKKYKNELLRQFADATEDSEFAVRHYAKDGVVLRYRMYAGITSPYLNRGGLQTKFEKKGEKITADERSAARKVEERWGATELHKLFPRLVGPPRPRKDKKTMEVVFYSNGYPPGEAIKRKRICPCLCDEDKISYAPNPKLIGSHSYKLYERYSSAQTVAEAKRLGARPIDFAHDTNWGFLTVKQLSLAPNFRGDAFSIQDKSNGAKVTSAKVSKGESKMVKVRVLEMSEGHKGMDVPRVALAKLAARSPLLRTVTEEQWVAMDGPFVKVPMDVLRVLLRWATTGRLRFEMRRTKAVYNALSKACGNKIASRLVKEHEAGQEKTVKQFMSRHEATSRKRPRKMSRLKHR